MSFLQWLEDMRSTFGDYFFIMCSFLGTQAVLILICCLNYWCLDKDFACEVGVSFFVSSLFVQDLKLICRVPRPFVVDPELKPVEMAIEGASGYSFPSAHTQTAASALIPAAVHYRHRKVLAALMYVMIILTGFSRMYLGVHTLYDVGGALLISVIFSVTVIILHNKLKPSVWYLVFSAAIIAGSVWSAVHAVFLESRGVTDVLNMLDSCKSAGGALGFALGMMLERKLVDYHAPERSTWKNLLVIVCGMAAALLIMTAIHSENAALAIIKYFLLTLWITFVYPAVLKKVNK